MKKINAPLAVFSLFLFLAPQLSAEEPLIETVAKANASLVTIKTKQIAVGPAKAEAAIDPQTGRILVAKQAPVVQFERSGAGVIIHSDGLIVTNVHTIFEANQVSVILHDGALANAKILQLLPEHDLALLKIDPPYELSAIAIADSDTVKLGDHVINIGHSDLLNRTMTGGIVYRLGTKPEGDKETVEVIQVNMNLYKGDSGGPLLDRNGRLVGMIAAKYLSKEKAALAIPSNKIKKLLE